MYHNLKVHKIAQTKNKLTINLHRHEFTNQSSVQFVIHLSFRSSVKSVIHLSFRSCVKSVIRWPFGI